MVMSTKAFKGSRAGLGHANRRVAGTRRMLTVAAAQQQLNAEIDKPLGLKLKKSNAPGGGCEVAAVSGNSAKAGLKPGDTVVYTSSWFGEELWPADNPSFVNTALARAPSPVYIKYVRGANNDIAVKRLPKIKAPARFGRKLTAAQKELATHICVDCGYIYCLKTPFEEQDPDYRCPQCQAPKKRFSTYDPETGKMGGTSQDLATLLTVTLGLAGVGVLAYLGLSL